MNQLFQQLQNIVTTNQTTPNKQSDSRKRPCSESLQTEPSIKRQKLETEKQQKFMIQLPFNVDDELEKYEPLLNDICKHQSPNVSPNFVSQHMDKIRYFVALYHETKSTWKIVKNMTINEMEGKFLQKSIFFPWLRKNYSVTAECFPEFEMVKHKFDKSKPIQFYWRKFLQSFALSVSDEELSKMVKELDESWNTICYFMKSSFGHLLIQTTKHIHLEWIRLLRQNFKQHKFESYIIPFWLTLLNRLLVVMTKLSYLAPTIRNSLSILQTMQQYETEYANSPSKFLKSLAKDVISDWHFTYIVDPIERSQLQTRIETQLQTKIIPRELALLLSRRRNEYIFCELLRQGLLQQTVTPFVRKQYHFLQPESTMGFHDNTINEQTDFDIL